ncbi:MAG: universal stress protein [Solirubrobacteraceae bacterium]
MARANDALTVVLGYDGSDPARRGVSLVGRLAAPSKRVVVVAVTPEVSGSSLSAEPLVGHEFDPERLLAEAAELLAAADGATVEGRAAAGDPAAVLVEVSREVHADLLVVGRKGSDFVARALLGSVAQRVVQEAACDVLVVA